MILPEHRGQVAVAIRMYGMPMSFLQYGQIIYGSNVENNQTAKAQLLTVWLIDGMDSPSFLLP